MGKKIHFELQAEEEAKKDNEERKKEKDEVTSSVT